MAAEKKLWLKADWVLGIKTSKTKINFKVHNENILETTVARNSNITHNKYIGDEKGLRKHCAVASDSKFMANKLSIKINFYKMLSKKFCFAEKGNLRRSEKRKHKTHSRPIGLKIHCSLTVCSSNIKNFKSNQCCHTVCLDIFSCMPRTFPMLMAKQSKCIVYT